MAPADPLPLPCDDRALWACVQALAEPPIHSLDDLGRRMSKYCPLNKLDDLDGLRAAMKDIGTKRFFAVILPSIIQKALELPALHARLAAESGPLLFLPAGMRGRQAIPRNLGVSLLGNMFLCTFEQAFAKVEGHFVCDPSFRPLLGNAASSEVAKLRMFLHFFERVVEQPLHGQIVIDRIVGAGLTEGDWLSSSRLLLPLEVAPEGVGFETAAGLAHADFANMFIGGGVLSGGCVQEEIRFSICPELCLSMLLCPCMEKEEAIQIVGAEQFSAYKGYMTSLRYGGNHEDETARWPDGTLQSAVLAMDALDLRYLDDSLTGQMSPESMFRDLNKSFAAFTPMEADALEVFPVVATGNWGCGAFGGFAPLKALVQWASASQCGRRLRYFPFEQSFGPELLELARRAVEAEVTVGQLLTSLRALRPPPWKLRLRLPRRPRHRGHEEEEKEEKEEGEEGDQEEGAEGSAGSSAGAQTPEVELNRYPYRLLGLVWDSLPGGAA